MGLGPFFFGANEMLNRRSDKLELLRIAEAVALEKSIDKELIINSMETGIAKAAKSKFGEENEIKVIINRENGDIGIFRSLKIVENPENLNTEISLDRAAELDTANKDKKIGDEVLQTLPSFDFGRIAAQTAKQVISFNVREAERDRQYNEFVDKKDTIVSGIVKRMEDLLDLGYDYDEAGRLAMDEDLYREAMDKGPVGDAYKQGGITKKKRVMSIATGKLKDYPGIKKILEYKIPKNA